MSSPTAGGAHSDIPSGLTAASCEPSAVSRQPLETQQCSRIFLYWSVCTAWCSFAILSHVQAVNELVLRAHFLSQRLDGKESDDSAS